MYSVVATSGFEKQLKSLHKKYPSLKKDVFEFVSKLKINPCQGRQLGKNIYKVRLAITSKNEGKSSGARVITAVFHIKNQIYLIKIYDKSTIDNLNKKEIKALSKEVDSLLDPKN